MKKDIRQKLERMRMLNKAHNSSSGGAALSGAKDGVKVPSSSAGVSATATATPMGQAASGLPPIPGLNSIPNYEAVRRAQELAAKMGFRQDPEFGPLINLFPGQMQTEVAVPQKPTKAPVLRVDALGREIDEHGNVVNVTKPSNLSTLKVNINKQKKDAFQILKPELEVDPESNPHFDARMGIDKVKLLRPKRMAFQFVEEGKWSKDAETIKLRNQFGEERARDMKARQALHAKAKAAPDINPNLIEVGERAMTTKEKAKDPIPEIEWWDVSLLVGGAYGEFEDGVVQDNQLKMEKITIYVEHPRINVVVVEGGSKSNKRYGNLMLRRINWAEAVNDEEDEEGGGGGDEDKPPNKCVLVWQGIVAKPSFNRFTVHECMTEAAARKIFADAGVVQYWDLAVNFSDDME
ncbi:Protein RDM16 [Linum perenne]